MDGRPQPHGVTTDKRRQAHEQEDRGADYGLSPSQVAHADELEISLEHYAEIAYPATQHDDDAQSAPWEQDDFDLAAKKGVNRGRQARLQQDRDAEEGGA